MFVLIWMTLLFSADTGASLEGKQQCSENPSGYCITLLDGEITAQAGLCVKIPCSFTTPSEFTPQSLVWYKCEPTTENCGDPNIIYDSKNYNVQSEFKGRVYRLESDLSQKICSIIINDLKESDSGSYQLRVNGVQDGKESGFTFSPRATLSVKDLRDYPKINVPRLNLGQQTTITCTAPGQYCPGPDPKLTWIWPGVQQDEYFTASEGRTSTLTFTPSFNHHDTYITCKVTFTGNVASQFERHLMVTYAPVERSQHCNSGYCITLPDREIIAEAGLCVEIPCSFDTPENFTVKEIFWAKCEPTCDDSHTKFVMGTYSRVFFAEYTLTTKICTITINDLMTSDSGVYQLKLSGTVGEEKSEYAFFPTVTLLVRGLSQRPKMKIPQLVEGEETTLTCTPPGLCASHSVPKISWKWWRGEDLHIPKQKKKNGGRTLTIIPSAEHHGAYVTCEVTFAGGVVTAQEEYVDVRLTRIGPSETAAWAIAGVSLFVNVLCFILILFLWNSRKKVKSNHEVRMYRSSGDDGSAQPLH